MRVTGPPSARRGSPRPDCGRPRLGQRGRAAGADHRPEPAGATAVDVTGVVATHVHPDHHGMSGRGPGRVRRVGRHAPSRAGLAAVPGVGRGHRPRAGSGLAAILRGARRGGGRAQGERPVDAAHHPNIAQMTHTDDIAPGPSAVWIRTARGQSCSSSRAPVKKSMSPNGARSSRQSPRIRCASAAADALRGNSASS